jgi:hypothetical protein
LLPLYEDNNRKAFKLIINIKNMSNQTKTANPRVEIVEKVYTPDAKLWVSHNDGEIAFTYPAFGPNPYKEVGQEILSKNLKVLTGDYVSSLLHAAYCNSDVKDEPEFQGVQSVMKDGWLWIFNRNLWTKKGVYVVQDLDATGTNQALDINELEEMLKRGDEIKGIRFSNDKKVRFAPKETYKLGEHTPDSFAKDGFIIASCGQQGAEKLAEVSAKFKNKPYIYGVETKTPEQRVSIVDDYGDRLRFDRDFDVGYKGHAFGVLKPLRN